MKMAFEKNAPNKTKRVGIYKPKKLTVEDDKRSYKARNTYFANALK